MFMFSRQIAYGLHELLRTNAANVHRREHWAVLFGLMEAAGAGVCPEDFNTQLDAVSYWLCIFFFFFQIFSYFICYDS